MSYMSTNSSSSSLDISLDVRSGDTRKIRESDPKEIMGYEDTSWVNNQILVVGNKA